MIYSFPSKTVQVQFPLNKYTNKQSLLEAIERIPYEYGITNTADAIKSLRSRVFSRKYGDRKFIPDIAVLLTDGVANVNVKSMRKEATRAKRSGKNMNDIQ